MRRRVRWQRALVLILTGCVAGFLLVELALRVATHSLFTWGGPDSEQYGIFDPVLGRVPRPNVTMHHPTKGFTISVGSDGTRNNGNTTTPAPRPLTLAVGDSFAFGDEVDDNQSWPAVLEQLIGSRVINGAVPGFGLDQAVMRAELLVADKSPDILIVSFIPHDILRCEMSYWSGHPKPYFEIDGAGLRLHPSPPAENAAVTGLKRLLSVSVTMDLLFPYFIHGEGPPLLVVQHDGPEVACRLMERLAQLGRDRHVTIIVLAQPQVPDSLPEHRQIKDGVLACAAANHLLTVDLFPIIDPLPSERRAQLFHGHMTADGNRVAATALADFIRHNLPARGQ